MTTPTPSRLKAAQRPIDPERMLSLWPVFLAVLTANNLAWIGAARRWRLEGRKGRILLSREELLVAEVKARVPAGLQKAVLARVAALLARARDLHQELPELRESSVAASAVCPIDLEHGFDPTAFELHARQWSAQKRKQSAAIPF